MDNIIKDSDLTCDDCAFSEIEKVKSQPINDMNNITNFCCFFGKYRSSVNICNNFEFKQ